MSASMSVSAAFSTLSSLQRASSHITLRRSRAYCRGGRGSGQEQEVEGQEVEEQEVEEQSNSTLSAAASRSSAIAMRLGEVPV